MQTAKQFIGGQWLGRVGGEERLGHAPNPATGEVAALFCEGTAAEAAVASALGAFENTAWKHRPRLRAEVLLDFAARLDARKKEIADWLVTLNGALRREALSDIGAGKPAVFATAATGGCTAPRGLTIFCRPNTFISRRRHEPVRTPA